VTIRLIARVGQVNPGAKDGPRVDRAGSEGRTEDDMSDQERIADLEHRLRETNSMLARLAEVVKRIATEVRNLPGVNGSSPAWRDIDEIVRDVDRARGR
jgi:hypothetical protein